MAGYARISTWWSGWHGFALAAALTMVLVLSLLATSPWLIGIRAVAVATAQLGLIWFLLAFTASAASELWPASATRWWRQNRRYLGLQFALAHTIHLLAVIGFALSSPAVYDKVKPPPVFAIVGAIGYLWLWLMAATSFHSCARWLTPVQWRWLHKCGSYYLWATFLVAFWTYLSHHQQGVMHAMLAVVALLLAVLLRIAAALRHVRLIRMDV